MTEERAGDRWWNGLPEDEKQRYLRAFMAMLAISISIDQAKRRREAELSELFELRRISKSADLMLAGVPAKRKGRART